MFSGYLSLALPSWPQHPAKSIMLYADESDSVIPGLIHTGKRVVGKGTDTDHLFLTLWVAGFFVAFSSVERFCSLKGGLPHPLSLLKTTFKQTNKIRIKTILLVALKVCLLFLLFLADLTCWRFMLALISVCLLIFFSFMLLFFFSSLSWRGGCSLASLFD